jgi:DnaJ homolog subfamily C member 28
VSDWGTYIDRQIRKAMEDGEFDNLPGEGKPLNIEEDENTPDALRLAYKILQDNDLAPAWIMQGKDIEQKTEELMNRLRRSAAAYRAAMDAPSATANTRASAARAWQTAQAKMTASAAKINQEISVYNLKVPTGINHKVILNIQREISRVMEAQ